MQHTCAAYFTKFCIFSHIFCLKSSAYLKKISAINQHPYLQVFCSKIPWLFQSRNDNFRNLIKTLTLVHKFQKWYWHTNGTDNETVLMEQYPNDKGTGRVVSKAKAPWSWNTSSFWMVNGSYKYACFSIFGDAKKSQISAVCMIQDHFPWFFKNNIFPWHFPDNIKSLAFPNFSWPVGTLVTRQVARS